MSKMSYFENIRNMHNINMSVLTKDLLTAKAALLDFNDFLISMSAELYGENYYADYYKPVCDAMDAIDKNIDEMLIANINKNIDGQVKKTI